MATDAATRRARATEREAERLERSIFRAKARLDRLRHRIPPEEIPDYELTDARGKPVALSDLFGAKSDLILVHNMGKSCPMCTTWADGFAGVAHHLEDRAALAVASPDAWRSMRAFAARRGWPFRMVSARGTTLFRDMGFEAKDGAPWPGVSTFWRAADGRILRVARASFGPGDDFSPVFSLIALLRDGQAGWWPKFSYGRRRAR